MEVTQDYCTLWESTPEVPINSVLLSRDLSRVLSRIQVKSWVESKSCPESSHESNTSRIEFEPSPNFRVLMFQLCSCEFESCRQCESCRTPLTGKFPCLCKSAHFYITSSGERKRLAIAFLSSVASNLNSLSFVFKS